MLTSLRAALKFNRHSTALLSGFLLTCFLIVYIWWPLAEEYCGKLPIVRKAGATE